MEKQMFTTTDFTNLCQFINCRSQEEFIKMYIECNMQSANVTPAYAMEKFEIARSSFINWWCNIDPSNQEKIIAYIKAFYQKY
jgi:hypothetical protein